MNTDFSKTLYNDLITLTSYEDSPFYYVDHQNEWSKFRVFNYRLASYTDFLRDNALNCRGTMFYIDSHNNYVGLASLPPLKFWNANENPITMNLDYSQVNLIMDKMDGSLMTTYAPKENDCDEIRLKSKTSITSEQANSANILLKSDEYSNLYDFLYFMYYDYNYSVSLEFCSPEFRIVVPYQKTSLTVLEARSMSTGDECSYNILKKHMEEFGCEQFLVKAHQPENTLDFINSIPTLNDGNEGFVIRFNNGLKVKIKQDQYVRIHKLIDTIKHDKNLIPLVVYEQDDDIVSRIPEDFNLLERIIKLKNKVRLILSFIRKLDDHVKSYHHLGRKEFVFKTKEIYNNGCDFSYIMNKYSNKTININEFIIDKFEQLEILANHYQ